MNAPTDVSPPFRALFACSGNICRSPLAEAMFKALAREAGLTSRFVVDSAGTRGFDEGDQADPRTRCVGAKHGLDIDSIARPVTDDDFNEFDLIVAMDRGSIFAKNAFAAPLCMSPGGG